MTTKTYTAAEVLAALDDTEQCLDQGVPVGDDNARVLAWDVRARDAEIVKLKEHSLLWEKAEGRVLELEAELSEKSRILDERTRELEEANQKLSEKDLAGGADAGYWATRSNNAEQENTSLRAQLDEARKREEELDAQLRQLQDAVVNPSQPPREI